MKRYSLNGYEITIQGEGKGNLNWVECFDNEKKAILRYEQIKQIIGAT
jgi:hypothetical protein